MRYFNILLFIVGLLVLGKSLFMTAKAELAQQLISLSWHTRQTHQPSVKPWPWADIHAIAKIDVPRLAISQYIMNNSSGEALAFGPGHLEGTSLPAEYGHSMISGHRDSHFAFLQNLEIGDKLLISNYLGRQRTYVIRASYFIDTREDSLIMHEDHHGVTLITCYPFNKLMNGGPLRWIVEAEPLNQKRSSTIFKPKSLNLMKSI